ncbi:unnamed protein product [Meloidogyne enterolobii]|uniref:Uncharacterized protein n=1 Tax=Meloidogyne enterolobii TaxID=390850 RepID=A0ACB1AUL6_MELEN
MEVIKFDVQTLKNWRATVEKQKYKARDRAQEDKGCGGEKHEELGWMPKCSRTGMTFDEQKEARGRRLYWP